MTRGTVGALASVWLVAVSGLLAACGAVAPPTPPTTTTPSIPSTPTPSAAPTASASAPTTPASPAATLDATALLGSITEAGLRVRLDALAGVSSASNGFRAVGTPGFDAAADLVANELRAAGWQVTEDEFTMPSFVDLGGSSLVVPGGSFGAGDLAPLIFAPAGDVTGPVVAIDWDPDAREPTGLGCSAVDYPDLQEGAIVLVRSGPCRRRDAILAAQSRGAAAFVAGYPSAASGEVLRPTLIDPNGLEIPAAAASRPAGDALAAVAAAGGKARLVTKAKTATAATRSIIAELPGSDPGAVIMLGAHLDSVVDGPGINDNGSGVAALLEIAHALRGSHPRATIRLAFWTGEELGLHGSSRYVAGLSTEDRDAIAAYLNADMLASPNGFTGVYDWVGAPAGSAAISELMTAAVERAGGDAVTVPLGGSDHLPFDQAGIPIGGVHSGASERLSEQEASASGSTAELPADACYHQACDDASNVNLRLLRLLTTALADVTIGLSNDPAQVAGS
jgi:hypothetical protein